MGFVRNDYGRPGGKPRLLGSVVEYNDLPNTEGGHPFRIILAIATVLAAISFVYSRGCSHTPDRPSVPQAGPKPELAPTPPPETDPQPPPPQPPPKKAWSGTAQSRPVEVRALLERLDAAEKAGNTTLAIDAIEKLLATNAPYAGHVVDLADSLKKRAGALNMRLLLSGQSNPWTVEVTVKRGDTAQRIAREHGTTLAALLKLNHLQNPDRVRAGYRIRILEFPRVRLFVDTRRKLADLELDGKFFKRYPLVSCSGAKGAASHQVSRDAGPRTLFSRLGLQFAEDDRTELEMFLAPGSSLILLQP